MPQRPRFFCVDDEVPESTISLLQGACAARNVSFHHIDARRFDFNEERRLTAGDLLYRPAVSTAAMTVEQFLFAPGVATFYTREDGVFFAPTGGPLHLQRAGLPVPLTFPLCSSDRSLLDAWVQRLGGYPVVLKVHGYSGGLGVLRVDSPEALYSVSDFLVAEGKSPHLSAFVDRAVHWRVTVVGDRAVSAYRNVTLANDFRTAASDDPADYSPKVPASLESLAVAACEVFAHELGGVDILEHPSGRHYVLEANFPCYFGTAQEVAGIDVAGAMLEHLLRKVGHAAPTSAPRGETNDATD